MSETSTKPNTSTNSVEQNSQIDLHRITAHIGGAIGVVGGAAIIALQLQWYIVALVALLQLLGAFLAYRDEVSNGAGGGVNA